MQCDIATELSRIGDKISEYSEQKFVLQGREELLTQQVKAIRSALDELRKQREIYSKSIEVLDMVQKAVNKVVKDGFEKIINYALEYIMGHGYKFEMVFGRRGSLQELDFVVQTPKTKKGYDPVESAAGGVLDVISLTLRVVILELHKPKIKGGLVLDEPFRNLSKKHLPQASMFLESLKERINRQIIMVTHKDELTRMSENAIEVKS